MHISAIRTYIDDLFPGEHVHKIDEISEMPKILRVETILPIQGQANSTWVEPIEGSMSFSGEAPKKEDI